MKPDDLSAVCLPPASALAHSVAQAWHGALAEILDQQRLHAVFQPIVDFGSAQILGYEGLIRGPSDSPLHSPVNLFEAADACRQLLALERVCRRVTLHRFAELGLCGTLFLNISPATLLDADFRPGETLGWMRQAGLRPEQVVIELTETRPVSEYPVLREATAHYRRMGFRIALDDLGEGFSNLRLWSELKPDFVKLDKYFTQAIHLDSAKQQFVRSIHAIALATGTQVIAEGIESGEELATLRQLGIGMGQGYFIERPASQPSRQLSTALATLLQAG